ncbi:competence/damage-inducible protein A [Gordonia zhaorongruii]|uniref:competence/damage-inducible protein A n=1 Tax=Gordonia zhaorongruii TaxID=2597659 RepID=UPI0010494D2B|nr:competence/damage-inducible protein A [Gordonia zhaorongruii]
MSTRAGIVVTGTEVLSGWITDRNGPWVSQQLLALGVEVGHLTVCGDRPRDLTAQLQFLTDQGVDLIVTTGGLGPTADDLTVATVADFTGRQLRRDADIARTVDAVVRRWRKYADADSLPPAMLAAVEKQSLIPDGAQPIPPAGTAPGVAVPAGDGHPTILILPGPPHELQSMWGAAMSTAPVVAAVAGRSALTQETIRAYGLSEPDLAVTLRDAEQSIDGYSDLEVTTCMRGGELEIVTRFDDSTTASYDALVDMLSASYGERIFSTDGSEVDDVVIDALAGRTVSTAESCTGGLIAARFTDRPGSSAYFLGGVAAYANEVKSGVLGVPAELINEHGAVSEQVAAAMADGARTSVGTDVAVSTTGIAGPDGARPGKPVGTVCFGVAIAGHETVTATRHFPGDRRSVRMLATVAAMHLLATHLREQ